MWLFVPIAITVVVNNGAGSAAPASEGKEKLSSEMDSSPVTTPTVGAATGVLLLVLSAVSDANDNSYEPSCTDVFVAAMGDERAVVAAAAVATALVGAGGDAATGVKAAVTAEISPPTVVVGAATATRGVVRPAVATAAAAATPPSSTDTEYEFANEPDSSMLLYVGLAVAPRGRVVTATTTVFDVGAVVVIPGSLRNDSLAALRIDSSKMDEASGE